MSQKKNRSISSGHSKVTTSSPLLYHGSGSWACEKKKAKASAPGTSKKDKPHRQKSTESTTTTTTTTLLTKSTIYLRNLNHGPDSFPARNRKTLGKGQRQVPCLWLELHARVEDKHGRRPCHHYEFEEERRKRK